MFLQRQDLRILCVAREAWYDALSGAGGWLEVTRGLWPHLRVSFDHASIQRFHVTRVVVPPLFRQRLLPYLWAVSVVPDRAGPPTSASLHFQREYAPELHLPPGPHERPEPVAPWMTLYEWRTHRWWRMCLHDIAPRVDALLRRYLRHHPARGSGDRRTARHVLFWAPYPRESAMTRTSVLAGELNLRLPAVVVLRVQHLGTGVFCYVSARALLASLRFVAYTSA